VIYRLPAGVLPATGICSLVTVLVGLLFLHESLTWTFGRQTGIDGVIRPPRSQPEAASEYVQCLSHLDRRGNRQARTGAKGQNGLEAVLAEHSI
jgi:hypothetical protein